MSYKLQRQMFHQPSGTNNNIVRLMQSCKVCSFLLRNIKGMVCKYPNRFLPVNLWHYYIRQDLKRRKRLNIFAYLEKSFYMCFLILKLKRFIVIFLSIWNILEVIVSIHFTMTKRYHLITGSRRNEWMRILLD